jgi:hypothetical protein
MYEFGAGGVLETQAIYLQLVMSRTPAPNALANLAHPPSPGVTLWLAQKNSGDLTSAAV